MMARKTSHSSKNFGSDAPLLLPVSRPVGGRVHESSPIQANACNAAVGGKSSSIILDRSSVRMEKAIMQSCWIQRLHPTCQTSTFEEEELTETSHVWTHFNKDFSSCSKRLHKAPNHTRSSSWPPNERTSQAPSSDLKLVGPVVNEEQYLLSRANLPKLREENFRVPFQDCSESNDFYSKTGNLFSHQNSTLKSVSTLEALVPCSNAKKPCDDFHTDECKGKVNFRNFASQHLKPRFNKESGSHSDLHSARVIGDAPYKGKLFVSQLAQTTMHIRGSSPDAVIRTSLSPAFKGASADADDRIKGVYLSTPLELSDNRPAVVFSDTKNKSTEDRLGAAFKKYPGESYGKEMKTRQNFGFLHVAGQSKTLNQSRVSPCKCTGLCDGGCSDKVGVYYRGSGAILGSKLIERRQNVGFGTFATNAGRFVTKESYDFESFNTDSRRCYSVAADRPSSQKEVLDTKMPWTRVSSGDFIRASSRETNLDECWVQLLKDSGPVKYFDRGYPKATRHHEHITDECHGFNFNSTANIWKPDEKAKLNSFPHPSAHISLNNNDQNYNSRVVPQPTQASLRRSFIQTKQTDLGHKQSGSASRSPLEGTSILKPWQEDSLQGGMRRRASKTGKQELLFDDGRITERSRLNEAWIQRWRSSSNLIGISGKTLPASLGMDKELGSAPAKYPVITSYKGEKDMDCVSKLHKDSSARHYNSGLGATAMSSFPVYKSHASLRGKYTAPSIEAMAIVGNTTGKWHTTLENRGSFSVWPCPSVESSQKRRQPEPREMVDDNMHGVDMDDLEFLECKMRF